MRASLRPLLICWALLADTCAGERLSAAEAACGTYNVALFGHGLFYFRDEQGQYAGIDKDLINESGRHSGRGFNAVLNSRDHVWDQMARGALDITVSGIANPERQRTAEFLNYLQTRNFVLLRK